MTDLIVELFTWFADASNWTGPTGIVTRVLEHTWFSVASTSIAAAIALPIGLFVGHTGRGALLAVNVANIGRAIPSFGIIVLAVILIGLGLVPALTALVLLAIPPILTNTYVGITSVDPEVRDAAEGMGFTGLQLLLRVELPLAMPLVMAGVRTAAVQVVATATIAAFVGLGGLGRFIFDGIQLGRQAFDRVLAGAILVALLSVLTEILLALVQRYVVPKGVAAQTAEAAADAKMTASAA